MISLKKLSGSQSDRLLFAAMIVVAANAGGAWSVIGDVTTTMLWIGGQITPLPIIKAVFLRYIRSGSSLAKLMSQERRDHVKPQTMPEALLGLAQTP